MSMNKDILFTAKANDVPNDQEISGKIESFDDGKFALDLKRGALVLRTVAVRHPFHRAQTQEFHLRFVVWSGIDRELITEILERELQTGSELCGVGNRFGQIHKKGGHLHGRFQIAFAVAGKKAACIGEDAMMSQAGENIQNLALSGQCMANTVCGDKRKPEAACEFNSNLIAAFFIDRKMALQLDVNIVP